MQPHSGYKSTCFVILYQYNIPPKTSHVSSNICYPKTHKTNYHRCSSDSCLVTEVPRESLMRVTDEIQLTRIVLERRQADILETFKSFIELTQFTCMAKYLKYNGRGREN